MKILNYEQIADKIIEIRDQKVILDSDVADFYGVETKHINQAVKNNPDKFPRGYIITLTPPEWVVLKSKFLTSIQPKGGKTKVPKAFTEKGLYMLATILKSKQATKTTIAIIDTFSKLKEIHYSVKQIQTMTDENQKEHALKHTGELITDLLDYDDLSNESETTIELNFAVLKLKHSFKKNKNR